VGWLVLLGGCREPAQELQGWEVESRGTVPDVVDSAEPTAEAGAGGGGPAASTPSQSAGAGAAREPGACYAEPVTLEQVQTGRVRPGVAVSLGELVASSQKFLLSEAKSGSCLWGAFVAEPERRGAGSGLLLVSFGPPHAEGAACESGSDGLPDALAPGDVLEVQGFVDEHVPAACSDLAPAWQLRVDAACPVELRGSGAAP
jgi:hypothetical protein